MTQLTEEQLAALKAIDTPTICNAIETFEVRGRCEGYTGVDIRCLTPDLPPMLGYAVTVTVDTMTPDVPRPQEGFSAWVRAMESAPNKPLVIVFKDVGPNPRKSAHMGEMMATLASKFQAVGLLTDGGVRDLAEVHALGFQYFALGVVASHGNARLLEVNVPVTIDGMEIKPGDLIHGDLNGVTVIPDSIADKVAAEAKRIRDGELAMLDYMNGPDFKADGYLQRRFKH